MSPLHAPRLAAPPAPGYRARGILGDAMSLASKTLFVTGASRGIGLAIALRAARDGANIAIAAKTVKPDPRLPGTIFTAAEEIEKAGGKALPLRLRHPRRAERREGGGRDRGQVRRHRHPGEQRQRHQPHRHAGHADEALRPDAPDQRARHLHGLAEVHPASAEGREPARAQPLAAARLRREVVRQPSRPTRSPSIGMSVYAWAMAAEFKGKDRLQLPVAAHRHRHRRHPEHAGRRGRHEALPQARDHGRRRLRDLQPAGAATAPATSSSTTRCWPPRASPTSTSTPCRPARR